MTKRNKIIVAGALFAVALVGGWLFFNPPCGSNQRTVNALRDLLSSQDGYMLAYLKEVRSASPPDDSDWVAQMEFSDQQMNPLSALPKAFDPNECFTILEHISMQPGYVLDYVYSADHGGAFPVLYARRKDDQPFEDYRAYEQHLGRLEQVNEAYSDYLLHVKTDDTPEGFLQLVILSVMGDQFYLYWHANYNDTQILCDRSGLEVVLSAKHFDKRLPEDVRWQARRLRVAPEICMTEGSVSVSFILFSKWSGFSRYTVEMHRTFPHAVIEATGTNLFQYNCKVAF